MLRAQSYKGAGAHLASIIQRTGKKRERRGQDNKRRALRETEPSKENGKTRRKYNLAL